MQEKQKLLQLSDAESLIIHHWCIIPKGCSQLYYN